MNVRTAILVTFLVCLGRQAVLPEEQTPIGAGQIVFNNGDTLAGRLTDIDTRSGQLQWAYPDSPSPFAFDLEAVSHAFLQRRPAAMPGHSQPLFKLTLTDGNSIIGVIQRLDAETLLFDAGLEHPLRVSRAHVHRLDAALNASQLIYQGPSGPNEWEVGYRGKNWQFSEGHLISESYSSTGRQLNIPGRARIELDVSLRDDPTLNIFLCADNPRNGGDSYYYLQLTPNIINCQRYWRDHPRTYINLIKEYEDEETKALFLGQPQVHLAMEIDRPAKRLKLFVNGKLYADFRDPAPEAPKGSSMILASYGNGAVRATGIRVYALERLSVDLKKLARGTTALRDGQSWKDTLTIIDGAARAGGRERAPVEQLLAASLAPLNAPRSSAEKAPLRFFLSSGGQLDGEARLNLEAGQLQLQHALLGELALPLTMIDGFVSGSNSGAPGLRQHAAASPPGRILFKNGDQLEGHLHRWDDDRGLLWNWTGGKEPLIFPARAAAEIHLRAKRSLSPSKTTVLLASGDALPGTITSLTPSVLGFETAFSTAMQVPLPLVRKVIFQDPASLYFEGPGSLDKWKPIKTDATWKQDAEGALIGRGAGGVSRALPLPDRGRLDVEFSWKGQLDTSITLFARELHRGIQPKSYRLHCEMERISLYRGLSEDEVARDHEGDDNPLRNRGLAEQLERFSAKYGGGASRRLGSPVSIRFQSHKLTRKITLCWDRAQGTISLLLDGKHLRTWEDPAGLVPPANGLILQQHTQATTLTVHALEIRDWNGVLPDPPLDDKALKGESQTIVRLRNQDEFRAEALGLAAPAAPLTFDTAVGRLALPTDRLAFIQFPVTKYPIEHQLGMVLDGHLAPRGTCRFFLTKIENGQLAVSSPYFGENVFDLAAFQKLVLDLQDRRFWDRQSLPWPNPVPLSMRPAVQQRQKQAAHTRMSEEKARDAAAKFNESVEFDE